MKIIAIHTLDVGPIDNGTISLINRWTEEPETKVLFTGPNGCGKSTLMQAVAALWQATGYWLDRRKVLPTDHSAYHILSRFGGVAIVVDGIEPFVNQPIGLFSGSDEWQRNLARQYDDVYWIGEQRVGMGYETTFKQDELEYQRLCLELPAEDWLDKWSEQRKKLILSHEKVEGPNMVHMDAEERVWVTPTQGIGEPVADLLSQRWLTRHIASQNWAGQLEASLITLKTTQLHTFHQVIRDLNQFLVGKEINSNIEPGENRLSVKVKSKVKGKKGVSHTFDELSFGERQVFILIYNISRWLQPGGVVMIDEPDLYLHPSLVEPLLATLEQLVADKKGQLIITSHAVDVWQRYENQGMRIELPANQTQAMLRLTA